MTFAVSILIPVYNVSNFIERCAHSLFRQTFEDIEYVFVNDCTPDDSIEKLQRVIKQYPNRKPFVKIIHHKENRGSASARNTAIDNASGKYFMQIDSDDYIDPDMVEVLYNKALETNADIVTSDTIDEFSDRSVYVEDYISEDKEENYRNLLANKKIESFVCNKIINRKLFDGPENRYPDGVNYWVDRHIAVRIQYFANKIVKINRAFYHYVHYNDNAITKKVTEKQFESILIFYSNLEKFLRTEGIYEKYAEIINKTKIEQKKSLIFNTNDVTLRRKYANIYLEEEKKYFHILRPSEKVVLFCARRKYLLWVTQLIKILVIIKSKTFAKFAKLSK
jgi:glycosyltransferase involved in cell wall biosynthesis